MQGEVLDRVAGRGCLAGLTEVILGIEERHRVEIVRVPEAVMRMIRAQDSLEGQEFYLGEALVTQCEVQVNGVTGYGMCLGDEPVRSYAMGVLDALREQGGLDAGVVAFVEGESERLERQDREEFARTMRTRVDFKLLEQE
jgi:alpha-D-ribose 1-methylphosphonate 5-triphosphate synthase subunit PhnG